MMIIKKIYVYMYLQNTNNMNNYFFLCKRILDLNIGLLEWNSTLLLTDKMSFGDIKNYSILPVNK